MSVLDLVDRTLADAERTTNAATTVTTVAKSTTRIVLSVGVVLIAIVILPGALIHFADPEPGLGAAVAVSGTTATPSPKQCRDEANKNASGAVRWNNCG